MFQKVSISLLFVCLAVSSSSADDIVKLDLLEIGCPQELNVYDSYWTTDFDLGDTFIEITDVYMEWSGEITGGLAVDWLNPDPCPIVIGIGAYIGRPSVEWRHTGVWGGASTYPEPQPFSCTSDLLGLYPLPELFNGTGTISLQYELLIILEGHYVELGPVFLDKANLVIEGVIPEPSTILLFAFGAFGIIRNRNCSISRHI